MAYQIAMSATDALAARSHVEDAALIDAATIHLQKLIVEMGDLNSGSAAGFANDQV